MELESPLLNLIFFCLIAGIFLIVFIDINHIQSELDNMPHKYCHNETVYINKIDFSGGIITHFSCNPYTQEIGEDDYTQEWREHYLRFSERYCNNETCFVYNPRCGLVAIIQRGKNASIIYRQIPDGQKEICEIK